ncbi:MAG: dihydroorotase [Treponema sp.]|nr:dihydroorotase [Treponema sp.]
MSTLVLKNFRLVDEVTDVCGSIIVKDGIIEEVYSANADDDVFDFNIAEKEIERAAHHADIVLDGSHFEQHDGLVLMPAFVDLHAHFRDPGFPEKETIESACLAAAAGGYGTVVCMANTKPVTDTIVQAQSIKDRSDALGLIDLYPVLSLTKGMEGKELSEIILLKDNQNVSQVVRLLSEDGKDVTDDALFLAAMTEACRTGIPVSCHCDLGGENNATKRAIELGEKASYACQQSLRLHIAHVSTKEAAAMIREAKKNNNHNSKGAFSKTEVLKKPLMSCEVTPHHIALTEKDAAALGLESFGKVSPPLRNEDDRRALIEAIVDGTVNAIATDHAPHTKTDKEQGAPGFTGLETAFAVCYSTLVVPEHISLSKLSSLMSAEPARILGLDRGKEARGRIVPGMRADFAIVDLSAAWIAEPSRFKSRGKNSPFADKKLHCKIVLTIHNGLVYHLQ